MLEMFHPFKVLMERIWAQPEFLYSFWGPYMHSIYPKSKVFKKPHLKQIEISLLCLRLAYERVSDRVDTLITTIEHPYRNHLRNLRIAFNFFIPTVSFVSVFTFEQAPHSQPSRRKSLWMTSKRALRATVAPTEFKFKFKLAFCFSFSQKVLPTSSFRMQIQGNSRIILL
jgi:hypothetical protein